MTEGDSHDAVADFDRALSARFTRSLVADSPALRKLIRRGPFATARLLVGIGTVSIFVDVQRGVPVPRTDIPLLCSWDMAVRGGVDTWVGLWQRIPAPGEHDVFALTKRGSMRIEGNLQPFMANLQYFKDLLAMPREAQDDRSRV